MRKQSDYFIPHPSDMSQHLLGVLPIYGSILTDCIITDCF